ncbi:MAG: polysaccharide deacetylase family protein, partial [Candidatus Omnitrophica bacterium]|nr:polysaccharide deacetylase family protein [Candidatus Omnitrophota bacterium]
MRRTHIKKIIIIITITVIVVAARFLSNAVYVPVIIMYHSIGDENAALDGYGGKLNVDEAVFEKQIRFLYDHKYNVIPLDEFIRRIKRKEHIPRKTVSITFDDGLRNNFTKAYPVLKKYGFPATIFVATDFIGKDKFLTWDDMKTMQKNNIKIGSHTVSHAWLPDLSENDIRKELFESKKILEDGTGRTIELLSYP